MTKEGQREAAHRHAAAALRDMAEMGPEVGDGYDLTEESDGRIRVDCGHDVRFWVTTDGEVEYTSLAQKRAADRNTSTSDELNEILGGDDGSA